MALTLDAIAEKVFKEADRGYSRDEVDDFLDEILEEMERREAETNSLKTQVQTLKDQLEAATRRAEEVRTATPAPAETENRRSTESFELVLSKAKSAYEEIISEADRRAGTCGHHAGGSHDLRGPLL